MLNVRLSPPSIFRLPSSILVFLLPLMLLLALSAAVQAEDYTYTTNDGTFTITGYTGPGGAVTIPSTINGLPVTSIGAEAFARCISLTRITIPNSVTSIGDAAFGHCISLTSVTIPNSVIGIGGWAFWGCSSLASITIPNNVTSIGAEAFGGCTSLTAITVNTNNPTYGSLDGVLFNKSQTTLIRCPGGKAGSYTIPNSVTNIWGNWIYQPYGAFSGCSSLTSVTIPDSVTIIGGAAFEACTSLTTVTIPNSVTRIPERTFWECFNLTSVTIGNNVTGIGWGAFSGCTSLTSITIPNSVTSIGGDAFNSCWSLTSVTIGNSVTSVGDYAFGYCTSLTGVNFLGNAPSLGGSSVFSGDNNATVYYLPGTAGWDTTYGGLPTALWALPNPLILTSGDSFGVQTNGFGFIVSWATNRSVVVEACTDLANPNWSPVRTNTLIGGWSYFSDPQWTNYPARFYRLRSP